ncbi:MAG: type II toxin-antitoxin system RelE/ParE family toxin [Bacteroidales bacterium]|nr:type II toxin-antitoxin system RelE/ParE family toxin [Bacteroidales bacterium]
MKIRWENIAEQQANEIATYIRKSFGFKRMKLFGEQIIHSTRLLTLNPYMGILDPLLTGRSQSYRSILINKLSKMVYYVDEEAKMIHISAFWDCRSEPLAQAEHLV